MSFSGTVKEELSRQISTARHCRIAETAALLSLCGRFTADGALRMQTENSAVIRKYFTLVQKTFNIETEIAPIVGSEQQARDLADYIKKESESPEGVWGTSIFGKSVEELVMDGMRNKLTMINDESQMKLQDSMQKIVNDSNGGLVCIII